MIDLTFNMENGDCELITDEDNMISACTRRLNTELDTTLYDEYGSTLEGLLGFKKTNVNLQFINQTIHDCLSQDERISDCDVTSEYIQDGFKASISLVCEDNELTFDYEYNSDDEEDLSDA